MHKRPTYIFSSHRKGSISVCLVVAILCSFTLLSCGEDEDDPRADASKALAISDVAYGGDAYHRLDLSLPAGRTSKTPIVVFIHGGGWREGSKEQYASIVGDFVANGFATATINYRPANAEANITYVQLLEDIDKALEFLQHDGSVNIYNGNDIRLFGHSAGAHLALLYAYRNNTRGQVNSVISLSAPTDLEDLLEENVFPTLLYNLVGSDDLEKFKDASPITHVTAQSVPTFFVHGKADESVPYQQSQMLFEELSVWNKISNRLELIDNAGHEFPADVQDAIVQESIIYLKGQD